MSLSKYVILFIIYSFLGWIFECTYCSAHESKWENRGFLYGPICPIYGTGAVLITMIFDHLSLFGIEALTNIQIFLIGYFGSIVLEYGTSWALEKRFHAVWWDYSNMPFNVQGRICLPASIGFGLAGLLIIRVLYPFMNNLVSPLPDLPAELLSLILAALLGGDLALTISALTGFEKELQAMEDNVNQHMALFVNNIEEKKLDLEIMIEEERERFTRTHMEHMAMRYGHTRTQALKRIKHFTPASYSEKRFHEVNKVIAFLKKKGPVMKKCEK